MTIYLYKKTHNKTGLQYLGKTVQNPFIYKGSGKDWVKHIREHGPDVKTEVIKECQTNEELSHWGRYFSSLWNIVESTEWANKIPETGGGPGGAGTEETRMKRSKALKGRSFPHLKRPKTQSFIDQMSKRLKGVTKGPMSEEQKLKRSLKQTGVLKGPQQQITCPHCKKSGGTSNMKRYHFDSCKSR
jgi:hypothetical protein